MYKSLLRDPKAFLPGKNQSVILSGLAFLVLFIGLQFGADIFRSSPPLVLFGGFLASLLFLFSLLCIGNLTGKIGWFEVLVGLVLSTLSSLPIHNITVTSGILFSAIQVFYLKWAFQAISNVDKDKKKRGK
eukprot:TRINITY_DN4009_c0_g1_i3.p1 TRINITY_DN4009_c0_g1~~TRINITY_DN4009_c0_g1_i3.p1  ORF type:complete len:131 (+),score=17.80 TRINITY_DN4009_c0_g1_i3:223-615(+)